MKYSIKINKLIYNLMIAERPQSISNLAKSIAMSKRSVNYYLKQIRNDEEMHHVFTLQKNKEGVFIKLGNEHLYESLKNKIELCLFRTDVVSKIAGSDVTLNVLLLLLDKNNYAKISDMADKLYYSTRLIKYYMKDVKVILDAYHLTLETVPYHGTRIKGSEINKRILLANIVENIHNNNSVTDEDTKFSKWYHTTNEQRLFVKGMMMHFMKDNGIYVSNEKFKILYKLVIIAHTRYKEGIKCFVNENVRKIVDFYSLKQSVSSLLKEMFHKDIDYYSNDEEIYFISIFLVLYMEKNKGIYINEIAKIAQSMYLNTIINNEQIMKKIMTDSFNEKIKKAYYSFALGIELNDNKNEISYLLKEDNPIISPLSFNIAYLISYKLSNENVVKLNDKYIFQLANLIHYKIVGTKYSREKLNIALSTDFNNEVNEYIKNKLLEYDKYGHFIKKLDILYFYDLVIEKDKYDLVLLDMPRAYFVDFKCPVVYLTKGKQEYIRDAYKMIAKHSINIADKLKKVGISEIKFEKRMNNVINLVEDYISRYGIHTDMNVKELLDEVCNKKMLTINGILTVCLKSNITPCIKIDLFKVLKHTVEASKTYIDSVCFVNYNPNISLENYKILEVLLGKVDKLFEETKSNSLVSFESIISIVENDIDFI